MEALPRQKFEEAEPPEQCVPRLSLGTRDIKFHISYFEKCFEFPAKLIFVTAIGS
jgi:hypothetical protein